MSVEPARESGHIDKPKTARVFFALWPEAELAHRIWREGHELQRRLGGRLTSEASVHMTLLFLGDVLEEHLQRLAASASVPFTPFAMTVDTAGCWSHNGVAWLAPSITPPALSPLVSKLTQAIGIAGFDVERQPFAPHITVVRKVKCATLDHAILRLEWQVAEYVLVRSARNMDGSIYSVIGRWRGSD
jgi:RNA 2',3'-cyclic 3'-phosphodiesterase